MEPRLSCPEVPKLDDSPEYSEEENTGQVEDQTTERDDEEIPGPGSEELPEENVEENILPVKDKNPHHNKKEIQDRIQMSYWNNTGRNTRRMRLLNPTISQNPGPQ